MHAAWGSAIPLHRKTCELRVVCQCPSNFEGPLVAKKVFDEVQLFETSIYSQPSPQCLCRVSQRWSKQTVCVFLNALKQHASRRPHCNTFFYKQGSRFLANIINGANMVAVAPTCIPITWMVFPERLSDSSVELVISIVDSVATPRSPILFPLTGSRGGSKDEDGTRGVSEGERHNVLSPQLTHRANADLRFRCLIRVCVASATAMPLHPESPM